jgi:hypothetical protein
MQPSRASVISMFIVTIVLSLGCLAYRIVVMAKSYANNGKRPITLKLVEFSIAVFLLLHAVTGLGVALSVELQQCNNS